MKTHRWIGLLCAVSALGASAPSAFAQLLIPVTSVTANVANNFNTPAVLVANAMGDYSYNPGFAGSGGGGTSWHTNAFGTTPVQLTFNFASPSKLVEFTIWDYYRHSPTDWTVKLFSGSNATGTEYLSQDFSIGPVNQNDPPKRWLIDVPNTSNVASVVLRTRNNSGNGGVGLSEVMFVGVPEPSSCAIAALAIGIVAFQRRRRGYNAA